MTNTPLWTDAHSWALLLGVLAPILIAVINRPSWPSWLRQVVSLVVAVALGLGDALASGSITAGTTPLQLIVVVLIASEAAYKTVMSKVVPQVERQTSPTTLDGEVVGVPTLQHALFEVQQGLRSGESYQRLAGIADDPAPPPVTLANGTAR